MPVDALLPAFGEEVFAEEEIVFREGSAGALHSAGGGAGHSGEQVAHTLALQRWDDVEVAVVALRGDKTPAVEQIAGGCEVFEAAADEGLDGGVYLR